MQLSLKEGKREREEEGKERGRREWTGNQDTQSYYTTVIVAMPTPSKVEVYVFLIK